MRFCGKCCSVGAYKQEDAALLSGYCLLTITARYLQPKNSWNETCALEPVRLNPRSLNWHDVDKPQIKQQVNRYPDTFHGIFEN